MAYALRSSSTHQAVKNLGAALLGVKPRAKVATSGAVLRFDDPDWPPALAPEDGPSGEDVRAALRALTARLRAQRGGDYDR